MSASSVTQNSDPAFLCPQEGQQALRRSAEHFHALFEQAPDGIFISDPQGRYVDVNSAGARMLGYSREEILQMSIADIIVPDDFARVTPEVERLRSDVVLRSEWKFKRKDGSTFEGEVYGKRLPDGRLQGILRDVSDRRRAEEALRQSEARFCVALKCSPITVFTQDCERRYTWIYNATLDWARQDVLGKTDTEILGAERAGVMDEAKRRVIDKGIGVRLEIPVVYQNQRHHIEMSLEPLVDSAGAVIGVTGAFVDIAELRDFAERLEEQNDKLLHENHYLQNEIESELGFETIVGHSKSLRSVLRQVRVVAPTTSTVLLLGETGTGKELIARAIHLLSSRRDRSFIRLNCAAVPTGLLESELFGHEKGAFTGAISQKIGRVELADKGTLFLDEVGELPLEVQPKLLRLLQEHEFERLGGTRTLRIDVRIIAATNRDLAKDVATKEFRQDLFYRLNVFPLQVPPLRDRRSDIPLLVGHFVKKHSRRLNKRIESVPKQVMDLLCEWNWPGNVRELENMVERLIILAKDTTLTMPKAELETLRENSDSEELPDVEREHIVRALRESNGTLSGPGGAAVRLGLKRTTLQSMLKRFNIDAAAFRI